MSVATTYGPEQKLVAEVSRMIFAADLKMESGFKNSLEECYAEDMTKGIDYLMDQEIWDVNSKSPALSKCVTIFSKLNEYYIEKLKSKAPELVFFKNEKPTIVTQDVDLLKNIAKKVKDELKKRGVGGRTDALFKSTQKELSEILSKLSSSDKRDVENHVNNKYREPSRITAVLEAAGLKTVATNAPTQAGVLVNKNSWIVPMMAMYYYHKLDKDADVCHLMAMHFKNTSKMVKDCLMQVAEKHLKKLKIVKSKIAAFSATGWAPTKQRMERAFTFLSLYLRENSGSDLTSVCSKITHLPYAVNTKDAMSVLLRVADKMEDEGKIYDISNDRIMEPIVLALYNFMKLDIINWYNTDVSANNLEITQYQSSDQINLLFNKKMIQRPKNYNTESPDIVKKQIVYLESISNETNKNIPVAIQQSPSMPVISSTGRARAPVIPGFSISNVRQQSASSVVSLTTSDASIIDSYSTGGILNAQLEFIGTDPDSDVVSKSREFLSVMEKEKPNEIDMIKRVFADDYGHPQAIDVKPINSLKSMVGLNNTGSCFQIGSGTAKIDLYGFASKSMNLLCYIFIGHYKGFYFWIIARKGVMTNPTMKAFGYEFFSVDEENVNDWLGKDNIKEIIHNTYAPSVDTGYIYYITLPVYTTEVPDGITERFPVFKDVKVGVRNALQTTGLNTLDEIGKALGEAIKIA